MFDKLFPVWVAFFCAGLSGPVAQSQEISRETPDDWEWVEPLLQSQEQWEKIAPVPRDPDQEAESVEWKLRSKLHRVGEDGSRLVVSQQVGHLLKESGKEDLATTSISFQPSRQRVRVIVARTILPDGTVVPVEDKGIFVESAKGDDQSALYTDHKRVKIVFPRLVEGAFVETIYAVEEPEPMIADHWTTGVVWGYLHPIGKMSLVVDLPASQAGALTSKATGFDLDEPVRQKTEEKKRVQFRWEQEGLRPLRFEEGMPHFRKGGPWLQVGTSEGWSPIGSWLAEAMRSESEDHEKLETMAREWADADAEPREIAETLFRKVSQEIRYTGFEFGDGAYEPRDPLEVLRTHYGDCKDKSNLLRVLLAHRGIPSRLALLNTRIPGALSKTIPSVGTFNHAILAVDFPGQEEPVFCDPTGDGLSFGHLTSAVGDRDALLIDEDGNTEWRRTPPHPPEVLRMKYDLDLQPDGGMRGWVEVSLTGAVGEVVNRRFSNAERSPLIQESLATFFRFFDGIVVVDTEDLNATSRKDDSAALHYRYYVIRKNPAQEAGNLSPVRFNFPADRYLITPTGSSRKSRKRTHAFLTTAVESSTTVNLALPKGWVAAGLPEKREFEFDGYSGAVSWQLDGQKLLGRSSLHRTGTKFSARKFPQLAKANEGIIEWLKSPVFLKRSEGKKGKKSKTTNWTMDPEKLPRMPSVDGFTALIQEFYPFDPRDPFEADHESRKKAFARLGELYPDDEMAQFGARSMRIVSEMFAFELTGEEMIEQIRSLSEDYEGIVPEDRLAGLELMIAGALLEDGERDAAAAIAEDLYARESIAPLVRQSAALILAPVISEADPARSRELAEEALENPYIGDAEWNQMATILVDAFARLPDHGSEEIHGEFQRLIRKWPDREDGLKSGFVEGPEILFDYGHSKEAHHYFAALQKLAESHPWPEETEYEWETAQENFALLKSIEPMQRRLAGFLKKHPWPDFEKVEDGDVIEFASECWAASYDKEHEASFRYCLRSLAGFGPVLSFTDDLSDLVLTAEDWIAEYRENPKKVPPPPEPIEALIDELIAIWKSGPDGEYTDAVDAVFQEGQVIARRSGKPAADVFFLSLATDESNDTDIRLRAVSYLETLRREQANLPGFFDALALYETIEKSDPDEDYLYGTLYRKLQGGFVWLANGKIKPAWTAFEDFAQAAQEDDTRLERIKGLLSDRKAAEAWWKQSADWWPAWAVIAEEMKIDSNASEAWDEYAPWLPDDGDLLERLNKGKNAGRKKRELRNELGEILEFARWHEEGAEEAAEILEKHVIKLYPDLEEPIQEFLTKLRP